MGLPEDVSGLAQQLGLDTALLYMEIVWALGEERINRVTPTEIQFREWKRKQRWADAVLVLRERAPSLHAQPRGSPRHLELY